MAVAAATDCGFEILPHPAYSPDLALSNFYLFSKLKSAIRGKQSDSDDAVIDHVEAFLKGLNL